MARKDALLRLHQRLIAKRDSLREKAGQDAPDSPCAGSGVGDVGDAAADSERTEINSQLASLESRELSQVERAIEMIRRGRYGQCEVCSGMIPVERLNILPFTPFCITCQRELEESGELESRLDADWETAYEFEGHMSDKEIRLGDIDIP